MSYLQLTKGDAQDGLHAVWRAAANDASLVRGTLAARELVYAFSLLDEPSESTLMAHRLALPAGEHLLRLDRVDFPPGGEAFLHTHQGPGIRVLLFGSITITTQGSAHTHLPGEPWFETGPDPVHAATHADEPSAFVRCMVLPAELAGKPSIRYQRDEDRDRPKSQRYTVFLDEPVTL